MLGLATEEDMRNYEEIMVNSGAMRRRNDPETPAANKGYKWQNIIKPIWDKCEKKKRNKKQNEKIKDRKARDSFSVTQALCVNGWNC